VLGWATLSGLQTTGKVTIMLSSPIVFGGHAMLSRPPVVKRRRHLADMMIAAGIRRRDATGRRTLLNVGIRQSLRLLEHAQQYPQSPQDEDKKESPSNNPHCKKLFITHSSPLAIFGHPRLES
jgi:hypothetical protein